MKKALFFLSLFLLFLPAFIKAQDLIVTYSGDSMNVEIGRIFSDRIIYSMGNEKGSISSRSVSSFQKDYYKKPADYPIADKPVLHFGVNYNWSYRLAKIPNEFNSFLEDYMKKLKSGYSYGLEIGFFVNDKTALGFTASRYRSFIRYDNVVYSLPDTSIIGPLSDDITISYYAPSVFFKYSNFAETINFLVSLSFGITNYENDGEVAIMNPNSEPEISKVRFEGSTIGLGVGFSADFRIDKNIYLGPKINLYSGTITDVYYEDKYTKGTMSASGKGESLARISMGGTLRFYF